MVAPAQTPDRQNLLVPGLERWPLEGGKPVIELSDVSIAFGDNQVLKGLSLEVPPGKTTVVIGRSGSGKSVLLKLMMGLLRPDTGTVRLFGRDLAEVGPQELIELRKRMSMLFQNYALLDALTVEDNIGFPLLQNTKMSRGEIMKIVHELTEILALSGAEKLLPSELSGGMRKRVSLARALVANPEVVLFDEPTTGLDPIMIEKVDEMIVTARETYAITSVIISHDMASTSRLSDRVAFLHDGTIIFTGTYQEFLHSKVPPVRSFVEGAATTRLTLEEEVSDEEETQPRPSDSAMIRFVGSAEAAIKDEPVVELINLRKSFGDIEVLKGVNLRIYPRRITVIIGASGSGKSVIIRHVMGLMKPTSGEVKIFGQDIVNLKPRELDEIRGRVGLLFQHAALLDWLSVAENVAFPLRERTHKSAAEIKELVDEMLVRLQIADIRNSMPGEISEGQKKRVGLARAIITKPEIMIYDEPTTGQDPIRTRYVDDMIQEAQELFDITSIVVSHDMASTFRVAHMIALLHKGEIAAYGPPEELLESSNENVQRFIYAGKVGD